MELTVRRVARLLEVPDETVENWIRQDNLPAIRVHGQFHINRVALQEWALSRNIRLSPELFAAQGQDETMPSLVAALERGGIHYGVEGAQRDAVLRSVTQLPGLPGGVDRELLLELLLAREALASTGIGGGIALPHPRNPLVVQGSEPIVLLAFLQQAVDFGAMDQRPVDTLFVLLSPSVRSHLQVLSLLSFALHDETLRDLLEREVPAEHILNRLRQLESSAAVGPSTP